MAMHDQAACRYTMEVQATLERIPQVRRILAAHLRHWDLEAHVGPVCRAVDALMQNVVRHVPGDRTCQIELRWTGRHLITSVADRDPRLPRMTSSSPTKGGLAAVAHLSDSWGTCGTDGGKVIWFTRRVKQAERVRRGARTPVPPVPALAPLPAGGAAGDAWRGGPHPTRRIQRIVVADQFPRAATTPTVSSVSTTQPNQSQPLLPSAAV
ncbi:ATP-binding protein [Streptomyces sp. NPDC048057]|uniref:ATP-binding protein n=1 Tax=Streptomyces sp. NPDC048057 TaxID=3155628 RepID=UPI0033DEFABE